MGWTRGKSFEATQANIEGFLGQQKTVYWWTFTEPGRKDGEPLWTKAEAEEHLRPFMDLLRRKKIDHVLVWEQQSRGAWHPHILINAYLSVHWLRPWMMKRGWGPQMRAVWIRAKPFYDPAGGGWNYDLSSDAARLVRYLVKYLQKSRSVVRGGAAASRTAEGQPPKSNPGTPVPPPNTTIPNTDGGGASTPTIDPPPTDQNASEGKLERKGFRHSGGKKLFGCSRSARAWTTDYSWAPWVRPGAWLYAMGRELFFQLRGRPATFHDMAVVIAFGAQVTQIDDWNPWWDFDVPSG